MGDASTPSAALALELRRMRQLSGKTLRELESWTFVSDSSLSRYLSGRLVPPWPVVATLCKMVRRDPRELRQLWEQATEVIVDQVPEEIAGPVAEPGRNYLPRDVADFTGREEPVRLLLSGPPGGIDAIDGMAGVGKTTLAVHVAHRLAAAFPDGQFYVDLHGYTPGLEPVEPMAALRTLLAAIGIPATAVSADPEAAAGQWRAALAGRRAVLVLDNAVNAAQVRPLLPGTNGCRTIVTSRHRLIDLGDARPLPLEVLGTADATDLFDSALGDATRAGQEHVRSEVARLCGHLPLAIRIAAARLKHRPAWTVEHLALSLRDEQRRLALLDAGDVGVATAFGPSYRRLDADLRRMFRLLGLLPGDDADRFAVAALVGLPVDQTEVLLEDLLDAHLVQQQALGRYRLHDLLRQYARQLLAAEEPTEAQSQAVDRLLDFHRHVATVGAELISNLPMTEPVARPPEEIPELTDALSALAWFDVEWQNLRAATIHAAEAGHDTHAVVMPLLLYWHGLMRGRLDDILPSLEAGLKVAERIGDLSGQARLLRFRSMVVDMLGDRDEAVRGLERALELAKQSGDRRTWVLTLQQLGYVRFCYSEYAAALPFYEEAAVNYRLHGSAVGNSMVFATLGIVYACLGRYAEAEATVREALEIAQRSGDGYVESICYYALGGIEVYRENFDEAIEHLNRSNALAKLKGSFQAEFYNGILLAIVYAKRGDLREAFAVSDRMSELDGQITLHTAGRGFTPIIRGYLHLKIGEVEPALACFQDALDISGKVDHTRARAYQGIARALAETDPESAEKHREMASAIFDKLDTFHRDDLI